MLRCESSRGCTTLQNSRDTKESADRLTAFGGRWAYRENEMRKSNTKKDILTQEQISSSSSTGRRGIVAIVFLTRLFSMRQDAENEL